MSAPAAHGPGRPGGGRPGPAPTEGARPGPYPAAFAEAYGAGYGERSGIPYGAGSRGRGVWDAGLAGGGRGLPAAGDARRSSDVDPAEWLLAASDDPGGVRLCWASGDGLADLPVGRAFDLVRMSDDIGTSVIQALHRRGATPGPVMLATASHVLSFLVPPGAAAEWKAWLRDTPYGRERTVVAAGSGRVLRCPRPGCVRRGHVWLFQPTGALTGSRELRAALRDVADHRAEALALPDALSH